MLGLQFFVADICLFTFFAIVLNRCRFYADLSLSFQYCIISLASRSIFILFPKLYFFNSRTCDKSSSMVMLISRRLKSTCHRTYFFRTIHSLSQLEWCYDIYFVDIFQISASVHDLPNWNPSCSSLKEARSLNIKKRYITNGHTISMQVAGWVNRGSVFWIQKNGETGKCYAHRDSQ